MEVMKVQSEIKAPIGQRGSEIIRRPMQGEAPVTASFQMRNSPQPPPIKADGANAISPDAPPPDPAIASPEPERNDQPKPDEWAYRHAQLLKRERSLHAEHQKIRDWEKALLERESRIKELEETMDLRQKDPKAFIEKNGLSYEKLTDIYLNDGKQPPEHHIQSLEEKIRSIEERLNNEKTQSEENWAQQQITGFQRQIKGVIDQGGEKFELIQAQKAHDLVYDVIQDYFRETKTLLPIEEAAKYVEDSLFEEAKQLSSLKKLQALQRPEAQAAAETPEPSQQVPSPQRTTSRPQQNTFRSSQNHGASQGGFIQSLENRKREAARMLRFNR